MHLLIDADDTLWEDAIHFREAVYTLAQTLSEYHHQPHTEILDSLRLHMARQQNIDIDLHGLGPKCFFISMDTVLQKVIHELEIHDYHTHLLAKLQEIEYNFYHQPLTLRANVQDTLSILSKQSFKLCLYTQGELEHQRDKLLRSALGPYFHEQFILPLKTTDNLKTILRENNIPAQSAVIIGNSTRSDINPAKELGLKTIHCKHPYTWERENHPMSENGPPTHVVDNFGDILNILQVIKDIAS